MKVYCPKCDILEEAKSALVKEAYAVKGEKIEIDAEVSICSRCGEKLFNAELDDRNVQAVYAKYRGIHNLLLPGQIAEIRKKYQLSQRALGQLLDWGEITINRYENGAIQDPAHNEVLVFISEVRNMMELFEKNKALLSTAAREKVEETLKSLNKNEIRPRLRASVEDFFLSGATLDEYSGFRKFSLDKSLAMLSYIVEKAGGVFTTKLNKLMWYSDFAHYKMFRQSISGNTYVHLPLGPVPDHYALLLSMAVQDGLITETEHFFQNGTGGVEYKVVSPSDTACFTPEEINTMDKMIDHFKDYKCKEIKDKSHSEDAYSKTSPTEKISYKYADSLRL